MRERTKTFKVFEGSTKTLKYDIVNADGVRLPATNVQAKLYDSNMNYLAELYVSKLADGEYAITIDTTLYGLEEGMYIVEFSCIAENHSYVRRDYIAVSKFV